MFDLQNKGKLQNFSDFVGFAWTFRKKFFANSLSKKLDWRLDWSGAKDVRCVCSSCVSICNMMWILNMIEVIMILLFNLVTSFKASTRLVTTHRATNRHLRFGPFQGHLEQRFSGTCRATFENMTEKWKPMEWTTASAGLPLCGFYSFQMMAIPYNTFRKKRINVLKYVWRQKFLFYPFWH